MQRRRRHVAGHQTAGVFEVFPAEHHVFPLRPPCELSRRAGNGQDLSGQDLSGTVGPGKPLCSDPVFSGSGELACCSCHSLPLGGVDKMGMSVGQDRQRGPRNAPAVQVMAVLAGSVLRSGPERPQSRPPSVRG
ncbi:MAG: cytochrome c peroxidase [Pseudorhodobacter sp.]